MTAALRLPIASRFAVRIIMAIILAPLCLCASPSLRAQRSPPPPDTASVKAHVKEILEQPEFRPESADSPMARLGRAFRERWESSTRWMTARWNALRKWFDGLFSGFGGGLGPAYR